MLLAILVVVPLLAAACRRETSHDADATGTVSAAASASSAASAASSTDVPTIAIVADPPPEDVPPVLRKPAPIASDPGAVVGPRGPRVIVAPITSEGMDTAEREGIERSLRRIEPKLRTCYEAGLTRDSTLEGTLGARVSIGPAGNVVKKLGTTLRDDETVSCVLGVLKASTFPLPQKRAPVVVPLKFER